jgi:macrolide transport system ATP-binding/permease protein
MVEQETESHSFEDATPQETALLEKWHVPTRNFSTKDLQQIQTYYY